MQHGFLVPLAAAALLGGATLATAQGDPTLLINGNFTSGFDLLNRRTYPAQAGGFAQGWSNLANLRLRAEAGQGLDFFASTNVMADFGFYAQLPGASGVRAELERLYLKAGGERVDLEAGLLRVARGYGYAFSPLDFLSPRDAANTLDPQARPPGRWGLHASFFPADLWRIELFGLLGDEPTEEELWGSRFGAATTFSVGSFNFDFLYALLPPEIEPYLNDGFTQIAGFALKADVEVGLFVEALYRLEQRALTEGSWYGKPLRGWEGLEAALGVDYTLGDWYLLGEYLFFGPGHVDWASDSLDPLYTGPGWEDQPPVDRLSWLDPAKRPQLFARHDYLFLLTRWRAGRDWSLGASCLAGLDDLSALFTVFAEYAVRQNLTLQLRFLQPMDRRLFDSGAPAGEWGSTVLGFHQLLGLAARVRF
jgi:hypothetical protein